jgi:hypothetical protein
MFVDWIDLAQDSDKWRAVVNTVMNLQFLNRLEFVDGLRNYLLLCFTELVHLYVIVTKL